jgi:excisionase family DNA binding protein
MIEKLLKVAQVAERLSCSESFVYNAVSAGELKHYRLGKGQGGIRVSEEQLKGYLDGREKGGEPEQQLQLLDPALRHLTLP